MLIEILNVTPETKVGKTGKPYKTLQVAFKNLTFGNKIEGKSLMGFGAQADAANALAAATPGSRFEVTVTKNASGFNDWTGAVPAAADAAPAAQPAKAAVGGYTAGNSNPRGFPTEEERAKTQVYIVRQSSLTNATAALSIGAKTPPTAEAVIERARKYEAYVFGQDENTGQVSEFDDVPDFDTPE